MNLRRRISNFIRTKVFDPFENIDLNKVVGWHSVGGSSSYGFYRDNQYENGYSSISKLGNGFAAIEPYTIDKDGKTVASNILDRIYTANTDMSAYDFREALAVTTLVHDKVRLQVHYRGENLNVDSITGFTFMENFSERIVGGKRDYMMGNGEVLTDDEVITLKSVNPNNINDGFSASHAARRWTRLDDYIADYQRGFFENNAIPAGEMIITAKTPGEFNDIVDMLQAKHKGASKNNNITYVHRPTDQNGNPLNSQIEWVPFSVSNKELSLKDLFENVNKKIDSVYGVPQEIRGQLANSNYASVAVAERVFVKYALDPMTMKIWSKFTHEINRVTGGAGVAITYDLDMPQIADEEKVKAEAKSVDAATVASLVEQGYTLESAVEYVNSGELYSLVLGEAPKTEEPEITDEIDDTPEQPLDIYAKSFIAMQEYFDKKFATLKPPEAKPEVHTKRLDEVDLQIYRTRMAHVIREQMQRQVNKAVNQLDEALKNKAYGDTNKEEDKLFTADMLAVLLPLVYVYGKKQTNQGVEIILDAGLSTEGVKPFTFTAAQQKAYERYLGRIGTGYADQTADSIRKILGEGILEQQTKAEIEDRLRGVILGPDNEYRVQRLADTEVNLSEGRASVSAMENIQNDTGYTIEKVWNITEGACEFCQALDGTVVGVEEVFVPLGSKVEAGDAVFENNWTDVESAELHANDNCYTTYRVSKGS